MRAAALIVACATGACSFSVVKGPSADVDEHGEPACSTSYVPPIVDTVLVAVQILDIFFTARESAAQWNNHFCAATDASCSAFIPRGGAIALYSAAGGAAAVSAWYGYTRVAACRDYKAEVGGGGELGQHHATP